MQTFNELIQKTKSNCVNCVFTYKKQKKQKRKFKKIKKPQGFYDWMIHGSYQDQRNNYQVKSIMMRDEWSYYRNYTDQLGVGYSSNNAGDGPVTIQRDDLFYKTFFVTRIIPELKNYFSIPSALKTTRYISLRSHMYKLSMCLTNKMHEHVQYIQCIVSHSILNYYMITEVRYKLNLIKRKLFLQSIKYKAFLNPDNTIQLGVGYSSNNAGDGPFYEEIEIKHVEAILQLQEVFDFEHGDIINSENFQIYILMRPIPIIRVRLLNGISLQDVFDHFFTDDKQLQAFDIKSGVIPAFACLVVLIEHLEIVKIKIGNASIYNNLERIFYLLYDLSRANNTGDVGFAVARAVHTIMEGKIMERCIKNIDTAVKILFSLDLQSNNNDDEPFFMKIRDMLENYVMWKDSPLFKKLYKLIMYIVSFFLFKDPDCTYESYGYTRLEVEILKRNYNSKGDFMFTLIDTITFLCEKGYQVYKDGYSSSIFHSSSKYVEFHKKCQSIIERSHFLNQTEALDENEYLAELESLLEKGEDILKCSKFLNKFDAAVVGKLVGQLRSIKLDVLTFKGATRARKAPLGILIYGNSGIGKTTLTRILIKQFCNVNGLSDADEYIYFRNCAEEFWNNFRTCMHTVILDDVSNEHPNLGDPKSVNEIIRIVNDANFVPNQASLEDKGRIPLRCKLCIATTNVKNLHAHHYFSCSCAVQRRVPHVITPTVKPEYLNEITGTLDPSKVPIVPEGAFDDLWYFKVERVQTVPIDSNKTIQGQAKFELIHERIEMPEFIEWYTKTINDFNINQNVVENAITNIRKTKACSVCKLPTAYCKCEVQSIEAELLKFAWLTWCYSLCNELFCAIVVLIMPYLGLRPFGFDTVTYLLRRPQVALRYFSCLGERVCAQYGRPKYLIGVPAALTVVYASYQLYKTTKNLQGNNQSKSEDNGKKPQPSDMDKRDPVWYNDKFELTPADVSRTTLSSKGNIDTIKRLFSSNCVFIRCVVNETSTRPSKAFCIGGQLYITNNHSIPNIEEIEVNLVQQSSKQGITSNIDFVLNEKDIMRIPDKDLCCFIVRNLPPKKDLSKYFCEPSFKANTHAFYFGKNEDGSIFDKNVENIKFIKEFTPALIRATGYIPSVEKWIGHVKEPTRNGDCGAILVSESYYGYCIVGIHMQGLDEIVASTTLDSSIIKRFTEWGDRYFIDAQQPILQSQNHKVELASLNRKSCLRYIEEGHAHVYGSFVGFRPNSKSKVESSLMSEVVKSFGYVEKFGKPVFGWKPYRIAALDCLNIPYKMNTAILDECVNAFINDIKMNIPKEQLANLHVYDDFTVLNGAAGVNYVDKIVRNTSAGFPFRKSKKHFMFSVPPQHDLQDPVDVTDEIKEIYHEMLNRYKSGQTAGCVFTAHLKDEPVSKAKQESGKTRVFSGANLPWTMVVRKYLLSLVRVIQENKTLFEAAPGIIAQGPEWNLLYQYLVKHGPNKIIAGDYGKFDKRMLAAIIIAAFTFIREICEYSGNYTEEDLKVIEAIGYDIAFSFQDFNGDLIQLFGSNPSGHPLTVIINCLVNSLYMRYVYYIENPKKECISFKQHVNLMTYGDDNIMGVSDDVPWFNHTVISNRLSEIGVVYTMPDKTSESVPYINIKEASFLKREWRFDLNMNKFVAPLDEESIEKMLLTWVRSKSITEQEQAIAVLSSANREYFFHGEEIFREKRKMFDEIVEKCDLTKYVEETTLPTYGQLLSEYNDRFEPESL